MWIFNAYVMPFVLMFLFLFGCFYPYKKTSSRVLTFVALVVFTVCYYFIFPKL